MSLPTCRIRFAELRLKGETGLVQLFGLSALMFFVIIWVEVLYPSIVEYFIWALDPV